jgi:hypothetical protein
LCKSPPFGIRSRKAHCRGGDLRIVSKYRAVLRSGVAFEVLALVRCPCESGAQAKKSDRAAAKLMKAVLTERVLRMLDGFLIAESGLSRKMKEAEYIKASAPA